MATASRRAFARIGDTRALERTQDATLDVIIRVIFGVDDGSAMNDAAISDQLRTLLFAGHETTAVILAWAIYFVLRDADVLARLRTELATVGPNNGPETLARLPYLGAVIDETLRIRPITADTFRLLARPWQFGKWLIPAGTAISPSTLLVHSDPELWPEPTCFGLIAFCTRTRARMCICHSAVAHAAASGPRLHDSRLA